MATRRSRRKRKLLIIYVSAATGVFVLLSVIIALILVVGLPNLVPSSASSSGSNTSQLIGIGDVVIPEYEEESLWWVSNGANVESESAAEIISQLTGSEFSRIPISGDVLFEPDESKLTTRATQAIAGIAETIQDPSTKVAVVCHSSSDGSEIRRLSLSEERANALANALELALGRGQNSIDRVGLGDSAPLPGIDGSTLAGRSLNRRCEVFVEIKK